MKDGICMRKPVHSSVYYKKLDIYLKENHPLIVYKFICGSMLTANISKFSVL